jgi:hypothetical protein
MNTDTLERFSVEKKYKPLFELWIESLKSGEYKQAVGTLKCKSSETRQHASYCCLGVLCTIAETFGQPPLDDKIYVHSNLTGLFNTGLLNAEIYPEQLYLPQHNELAEYLIYLNDGTENLKQHNFSEIANFLENNIDYV